MFGDGGAEGEGDAAPDAAGDSFLELQAMLG